MCLANVYRNGEMDQSILIGVAYLKLDGNQIEVENWLGESKIFQGKIKEIDFLNYKIVIDGMVD